MNSNNGESSLEFLDSIESANLGLQSKIKLPSILQKRKRKEDDKLPNSLRASSTLIPLPACLTEGLKLVEGQKKMPTIELRTITQQSFELEVENSETILQLKQKIAENKGGKDFPVDGQKLIYNGKVLEDNKTIGEVNVAAGKFIVVMVVKKAAPKASVTEATTTSEEKKSTTAEVKKEETPTSDKKEEGG
uniref:Ubiquitin-like domain-containing protein n=1 Tax=Meloidogyne floridensis TaxID=298350 RepID=A0A915NLZ6_9BILA